jgi:hypothetical protein
MKKQIIKGAKPANTSKTSTSNSTSPKTSAKESSTSTTSKHPTADTNPTTAEQTAPTTSSTSKQSAVGSKVVVENEYYKGDHAIWIDTNGEELSERERNFVVQLVTIGHVVALLDREDVKHPRITLLASLMRSAAGLSAEDLIADAHRREILNLDDDIKREVVALKRKALPMCSYWIEDMTNAEANGEDMEAYLDEARCNLEGNFADDIFFEYL